MICAIVRPFRSPTGTRPLDDDAVYKASFKRPETRRSSSGRSRQGGVHGPFVSYLLDPLTQGGQPSSTCPQAFRIWARCLSLACRRLPSDPEARGPVTPRSVPSGRSQACVARAEPSTPHLAASIVGFFDRSAFTAPLRSGRPCRLDVPKLSIAQGAAFSGLGKFASRAPEGRTLRSQDPIWRPIRSDVGRRHR
jgi:hypothetical protein